MKPKICDFTTDDYQAIADIDNAEFPEYPGTAEEVRFQDHARDPKCRYRRWVTEVDGHVVAYANYEQWSGQYHPRKFSIYSVVHPKYQGNGIAKALHAIVMDALKEFDPISLRSNAQESRSRAIRFLTDRGFKEEMRAWESRLDVEKFDLAPYVNVEDKPRSHGIEIKTIRELEEDPERDRKLYELDMKLLEDVPSPDRRTDVPFEWYIDNVLKGPDLLPDAYFVALHAGNYVGMSNIWSSEACKDLYTGLTGVRREFRHKGIALALKIRGIRYAKEHGHPVIKTWNETRNRPILEINERLGFVKQPADITFCKVLKEEGQ